MIGTHFIDLSTISNDGKTGEFHQISQDSEPEGVNLQIILSQGDNLFDFFILILLYETESLYIFHHTQMYFQLTI